MNRRDFSLRPFLPAGLSPDLEIAGSIERCSNTLSIGYALSGPLDGLIFPAPADIRRRKNALWKETCFEFFLGIKGSECYWEFNLSPSGHWNVYGFKSYRLGMREEPALTSLPFGVQLFSNSLQLSLGLELDKVIPAEQLSEVLQIGLSAVIKTTDGKTTFWALAHPGPEADFHRRDSFLIEL